MPSISPTRGSRIPLLGLLAAGMAAAAPLTASAADQIFVVNAGAFSVGKYASDGTVIDDSFISGFSHPIGIAVSGGYLLVSSITEGSVQRFDLRDGSTPSTAFVTGLSSPYGITVADGKLFAANYSGSTIGEYDAATGATLKAAFVSGLTQHPEGMVVANGNLYVTNFGGNTIGEYNATTGAAIHATLISGLNGPVGLAAANGYLYVTNYDGNSVGKYNAATGAAVKADFITGLDGPQGIAIRGGNLLVANSNSSSNSVGEYDAGTGAVINPALISGLHSPQGIAVVSTTPAAPTAPAAIAIALAGKKRVTTTRAAYVLKGSSSAAITVRVKVGHASFKIARGTPSWTCKIRLRTGVNHVTVQAIGSAGASRSVKLVIKRI